MGAQYKKEEASQVTEDLEKNHGRKTSRKLVQNLGAAVGKIVLEKELVWVAEGVYLRMFPNFHFSNRLVARG